MKTSRNASFTKWLVIFTAWSMLARLTSAKDLQIYWDCKEETAPDRRYPFETCASNMLLVLDHWNGTTYSENGGYISNSLTQFPVCLVNDTQIKLQTKSGDDIPRAKFSGKVPDAQTVCDKKIRIRFYPTISNASMNTTIYAQQLQQVADCIVSDLQTPHCKLSFDSDAQILSFNFFIAAVLSMPVATACILWCRHYSDKEVVSQEKFKLLTLNKSDNTTQQPDYGSVTTTV